MFSTMRQHSWMAWKEAKQRVFLPLSESIGQGATFWLFGAVCALTLLFIVRRVPETKNRTLAQINDSLHISSPS